MNMAASYIITEGIKREYLEFGTFKGTSLITAYKAFKNRGQQKATKEWLEKNKHITLLPLSRCGIYQYIFIVYINQNV